MKPIVPLSHLTSEGNGHIVSIPKWLSGMRHGSLAFPKGQENRNIVSIAAHPSGAAFGVPCQTMFTQKSGIRIALTKSSMWLNY